MRSKFKSRFLFHWVVNLLLAVMPITAAWSQDSDGDGLSDSFEEALLRKFLPRFLISEGECDQMPAEFQPGIADPIPLAKNGTLYGQVFRATPSGRPGEYLEIHYYHLWGRDCGTTSHLLDVEHVSTLIQSGSNPAMAAEWKAVAWYAAAHEDTVCEASQMVRAGVIGGEKRGPDVWISRGKHASFFNPELCRQGCGGDDCTRMRVMPLARLLNLGEPAAPMNGAIWVDSPRWPFREKMKADFTPERLAELDAAPDGTFSRTSGAPGAIQGAVHVGSTTADAISNADQQTDQALTAADEKASGAAGQAARKVGRSLKLAARKVGKVFSGGKEAR